MAVALKTWTKFATMLGFVSKRLRDRPTSLKLKLLNLGSLYNKDPTIYGTILGSPIWLKAVESACCWTERGSRRLPLT